MSRSTEGHRGAFRRIAMHDTGHARTNSRHNRHLTEGRARAMPMHRGSKPFRRRQHSAPLACDLPLIGSSSLRAKAMNPLAYPAYQAFANFMLPLRHGASLVQGALDAWPEYAATPSGRTLRASAELLTLAGLTHGPPPFGIDSVEVEGQAVDVIEEVVQSTPFCLLLHFRKHASFDVPQPRVLVIAPMSGHFATLLRGTVRTML